MIPDAFDEVKANFSGLGKTVDENPIYIGDVKQKTTITLDKNGTKAAAATIVAPECGEGMPEELPVYHITLDRPFVYMIVDSITHLPIFIGIVEQL